MQIAKIIYLPALLKTIEGNQLAALKNNAEMKCLLLYNKMEHLMF